MATTVPPGNHYKVRIRTMQAASNAALAGGSSSTKQGHPIAKAPAMRYSGILVRDKPTQYRCNCGVQGHIEPFLLSPDTSKADTTHRQPLIEALCKPANKPLCEPVPLHK